MKSRWNICQRMARIMSMCPCPYTVSLAHTHRYEFDSIQFNSLSCNILRDWRMPLTYRDTWLVRYWYYCRPAENSIFSSISKPLLSFQNTVPSSEYFAAHLFHRLKRFIKSFFKTKERESDREMKWKWSKFLVCRLQCMDDASWSRNRFSALT